MNNKPGDCLNMCGNGKTLEANYDLSSKMV